MRGSGPNGRVTREDVQRFVKGALQRGGGGTAAVAVSGVAALGRSVDFAQYGEIERAPLSRIKRLSGPNLHRNWLPIPHITNYDEADVTDLEAFRNEINAEQSKRGGAKLTMLAFLVKACVAALQRFPEFNASLDGDELVYKRYYNIGFAADTPGGLVVPVLKNADAKGLARDRARERGARRQGTRRQARARRHAGRHVHDLVHRRHRRHAVHADRQRAGGRDPRRDAQPRPNRSGTAQQFVPRLMLPISVSYDHRVIDGAGAARFLVYVAGLLRDFRRVLL